MYCDYQALAEYAVQLNKNFKTVTNSISSLESYVKLFSNFCQTETEDYFMEKFRSMQDNFDIITNQFQNVNQYLDQVIENYQALEKDMSAYFGGM